jgi:hypothetical protein
MGVSVVYLQDIQRGWYTRGVVGLGDDYDSAVKGLRAMGARWNARRILTMGNSHACFGALSYGLSLDAQGVLGIAPNIRASSAVTPMDRKTLESLRRRLPANHKDIHTRYIEAESRPDVTLIYGAEREPDASDARFLSDVPGVKIAGLPGASDHGTLRDLLVRGLLEPVLQEFVANGTVLPNLLAKISTSANSFAV